MQLFYLLASDEVACLEQLSKNCIQIDDDLIWKTVQEPKMLLIPPASYQYC